MDHISEAPGWNENLLEAMVVTLLLYNPTIEVKYVASNESLLYREIEERRVYK